MAATETELIELVRGLTSTDVRTREATCGTITDWISVFDMFQARMLAMTLAVAAAAETDRACRESELHALSELSDTGYFGVEFFEPVGKLDRGGLALDEKDYIDALMELDY